MSTTIARRLIKASQPKRADIHRLATLHGPVTFDVATSRLYLGEFDPVQLPSSAAAQGPGLNPTPKVRALSLAIAQTCNLGCTYCYAQGGSFGQPSKAMALPVAIQAIDRLLGEAVAGETVNLSFLGGEPLVNRDVLRAAARHAFAAATRRDVRVNFALTTNGTLIKPEDADFFEEHAFAVTISLDGKAELHDALRPFRNGRGTYAEIMTRVQPLLKKQRRMQVSARVTVTPRNLELHDTLRSFLAAGFHSVGFSPMLSSPAGQDQMGGDALVEMLEQMVACGIDFEREIIAGRRYAFLNMVNAMREIHRHSRRLLPCGAGDGYFGVSADGELFACHRFVGEERAGMGDLASGVDRERQDAWLSSRRVDRQEPCRSCWARHLCGGGCHHEVLHRGRVACDFIRGWLHYALSAYLRLAKARPDYFAGNSHAGAG